jgi:hypothetical protein
MQVKCDELGRLQKENGDRLGAAAAEDGPDITTIANARAEATAAAAEDGPDITTIANARAEATAAATDLHAKVDAGHEPKSSEAGPSRKRSRLN